MDALPRVAPGAGFALLEGVRVVDLTTSIAGPYAGMLLGDMGADVIKVERTGVGDDGRAWGPPWLDGESLLFMSVNRNKRSVALDYAKPEGYAVLRDLVARADVFLVNQLSRSARKLGVDPDAIRAIKGDIVYASITGFGLSGERADWACYDLIAEGYSGVMDLTGARDSEPQKIGTPAADLLSGQDAALAVVAALYQRTRAGQGRTIEVSLVESMTRFMACRIVPYLGSGRLPRRSGAKDSVIAVYQSFDTADEPITLGLNTPPIWQRFWQCVGRADYLQKPGLATNAEQQARRAEIVGEVAALLKTRPRAEWLTLFAEARVPAGPINRLDEVAADPLLIERGLFYNIAVEDRAVPQVGLGVHVDGAAHTPRLPPPLLGAHTREVLTGLLGYDEERLNALGEAGVI
jgi:crotonobetainyl-CoA:carnitine CoA-transferase CaiB-like acyl-CoA transferase